MLIKYYSPSKHKSLNNDNIENKSLTTNVFKGIKYPTKPIEDVFNVFKTSDILHLIEEQQKYIKKEADIFLKYNWISSKAYEITLDQYNNLYYYEDNFYKITDLKLYITKQNNQYNTYIETKNKEKELNPKQTAKISRQAIRNLTWYSPYFTPTEWDWEEAYVKRQDDLIKDETDLILVLGSRQIWKSLTLSEKAIEESHLPNNTILVWAFTTSSTNTIRNYLRRFIRKFPEWYWEENKSERFIQNMKTWSKIFFRTLADDAVDAIRWMTLNTILVDEAQLVSEYAYLDVLEPTLATTGWKMILIWTPPKIPDWFFVEQIFKYKKWELDNASFYEIKLPDQPFTHPKVREKKMNMMDDPRTQREWFCNLTTDIDVLFTPKLAKEFPELVKDKSTFYVIWIDPARKKDRSWYCVIQVKEWIATSIESWFIPDTFKKDWKLQAIFLKRLKSKYDNYWDIITVIDSSWVWDWVLSIFREHGLNIKYTVRYTSWQTKMLKNTDYTVWKHVLINNVLDIITEQLVEVVDITNRQMIEEMKYIYEVEFKSWLIWFKTKFYDDITNAFMIALFIVSEKNLISRSLINPWETIQSTWASVVDAIERRLPQWKTSQAW